MEPGTAGTFDGVSLRYSIAGAGETLVILIHGWCCSGEFWVDTDAMFNASVRVVTLDLPGHGHSAVGVERRQWSVEHFARDIECLADALQAQSVVLVGHSMGGAVAVEAALRLGTRCRFILGVDTFTDAAFYGRRTDDEIARRLRSFEPNFGAAIASMVDDITAPGLDRASRARIAAAMAQTDVTVALAVLAELLAWDIEARWPRLHCPVATINSALLGRRGTALALPGLRVHEMEFVGHFPMIEDPPRFCSLARTLIAPYLARGG